MLSTHKLITTYKGVEIYQRLPGFEYTPILLGKIASFIAKGENTLAVFAFSYSMLDAMEKEIKEDNLLQEAVEIIKKYIEQKIIKNNTDYTYEYKDSIYFPVNLPKWWIASFTR